MLEQWDRVDLHDDRWFAVDALLLLDAPGFSEGMSSLIAMHDAAITLLDALMSVTGQADDAVEWKTMRAAKEATEALPRLYAQLENEIAEVLS